MTDLEKLKNDGAGMTCWFPVNAKAIKGNPLNIETPFGVAKQISIGNEFNRADFLEAQLEAALDKTDALKSELSRCRKVGEEQQAELEAAREVVEAAQRMIDNANGHYMNAEDRYALTRRLGHYQKVTTGERIVAAAQEVLAYARGQSDLRASLSPGDRVGPGGGYVVVPVELVALVSELIESDSDHQTEWDEDAKRLLAALKEQDK